MTGVEIVFAAVAGAVGGLAPLAVYVAWLTVRQARWERDMRARYRAGKKW